jgi:hypothetical protein
MFTNEVNKFGQIFLIYKRRNTRIWGNFHPFDFTPKSHLRRIILCQGYSTFFPNLFQNHSVYTKSDYTFLGMKVSQKVFCFVGNLWGGKIRQSRCGREINGALMPTPFLLLTPQSTPSTLVLSCQNPF